MQHLWVGGGMQDPLWTESVVRYYVDGETTTAALVLPLGPGHGMSSILFSGFDQEDDGPWSAAGLFGKTGSPSGIFNTYPVPFESNIRVTVQLAGPANASTRFWIILRGTDGLTGPLTLPGQPGLVMPPSARLRSHMAGPMTLGAGDQLQMLSSSARNGAVLMSTLAVRTEPKGSPTFLEGCVRAWDIDTTRKKHPKNMAIKTTEAMTLSSSKLRMLMSSGTEDYFAGTYYFNKGQYTNALAGVTALCPHPQALGCQPPADGSVLFSAYRVFTHDPLIYQDGMVLTWRNGDPEGCDLGTKPNAPSVNASAFALVYEW